MLHSPRPDTTTRLYVKAVNRNGAPAQSVKASTDSQYQWLFAPESRYCAIVGVLWFGIVVALVVHVLL